jgi:hypothetical protein
MRWLWIVCFALWIAPEWLSAGTFDASDRSLKHWEAFNKAADDKTKEIKALVFGPITKIIGMLGIAYGVFSMLATASPKPLIMYGGIGLLLNIIPYFIDSVFGAVLPGF